MVHVSVLFPSLIPNQFRGHPTLCARPRPGHCCLFCPNPCSHIISSLFQLFFPHLSLLLSEFLISHCKILFVLALVVPVDVQVFVPALFLIFVPALSQSCSCTCHSPSFCPCPIPCFSLCPNPSSRCHCACSSGSPCSSPCLKLNLYYRHFPMSLFLSMSFSVLLSIYDVPVFVPVKQSSPCSVLWTEYVEFGFPPLWQYFLCGEVQYRTRVHRTH